MIIICHNKLKPPLRPFESAGSFGQGREGGHRSMNLVGKWEKEFKEKSGKGFKGKVEKGKGFKEKGQIKKEIGNGEVEEWNPWNSWRRK